MKHRTAELLPHDACLPTVLVVDDIPNNLTLISDLLAGEYRCRVAVSGPKALAVADSLPQPDVILLDIAMPDMDGYEVCRRLKANPRTRDIPVIFLTALDTEGDEAEGFNAGGVDYITKPVNKTILLARLNAHLTLVRSRRHLSHKNDLLEQLVSERGKQLTDMQNVVILAMAYLAETHNHDTDAHIRRVQHYTRALALSLRKNAAYAARLTDDIVDMLFKTCPLHDIGKVGVSDGVLFKPGKLSQEEFEEMKRHATFGGKTLLEVERQLVAPETFVTMAYEIAMYHHERWDGAGYPLGVMGEEIPLSARIVALADTYDALVSHRVYKPAGTFSDARAIIMRERGKQFEPALVDAFLACEEEFIATAEKYTGDDEEGERSHVLQRLIETPS